MSMSENNYQEILDDCWRNLSPGQQAAWQLYADRLGAGLTGFEAFCQYNIDAGKPTRPSPEPPSE